MQQVIQDKLNLIGKRQ